jgi:DNA-binding GntR family transcriptional regulator
MRVDKIQTKTLRHQVYEQLRKKILSAESLMPVREALWQLESEHVVVIERNRSMRVNNLSPSEMEAILRIRITLETMAVQRACVLRPDSALPKVERILEEMEASTGVVRKYLGKNTQFHFAIYELSQDPILVETIDRLWARIGPYLYLLPHEPNTYAVAMKWHHHIFRALVNRDKRGCARALKGDLESAAEMVKPFLKSESRGGGDS